MICYLFPGQGSQAKGMGEGLFDEFPALTEKADNILGYSIKELCLKNENLRLHQTQFTQPAVYVVNALCYQKKIKQNGRAPAYFAGHSLGEYNALQAAGVFSFEDGLRLVKKRGELMAQAGQGAMAAVLRMSKEHIQYCLDRNSLSAIDIANYNGPTQIVISGLPQDISKAQSLLEQAGADFIPLNTSGAFHSRYMEPIKLEFTHFLEKFQFSELRTPVISNIHAKSYQYERIKTDLANQITHPVRWQQSMEYLLECGVETFEEIGNGDVLTKLMASIKSNFTVDANHNTAGQPKSMPLQIVSPMEQMLSQVNDWNQQHKVGAEVIIQGNHQERQTRTEAMILFGHKAVIYIEGYKGYFELNQVTAVSQPA